MSPKPKQLQILDPKLLPPCLFAWHLPCSVLSLTIHSEPRQRSCTGQSYRVGIASNIYIFTYLFIFICLFILFVCFFLYSCFSWGWGAGGRVPILLVLSRTTLFHCQALKLQKKPQNTVYHHPKRYPKLFKLLQYRKDPKPENLNPKPQTLGPTPNPEQNPKGSMYPNSIYFGLKVLPTYLHRAQRNSHTIWAHGPLGEKSLISSAGLFAARASRFGGLRWGQSSAEARPDKIGIGLLWGLSRGLWGFQGSN